MTTRRLTYDGTTYELRAEAMADLLARGIIVPDASSGADYSLSLEHVIEDVEPFATVVERSDAPKPRRLGQLRARGFSLTMGPTALPNLFPTTHQLGPDEKERDR